MSMFRVLDACVMLALPAVGSSQVQQPCGHQHAMTDHARHMAASQADARQLVKFPEPLRSHTPANMRDHWLALGEIQAALSRSQFDQASDIAEQRLGMSSLKLHGAHEVAKFMPKGTQDAGTAMHRSASQFAATAKDASVTGDLEPALAKVEPPDIEHLGDPFADLCATPELASVWADQLLPTQRSVLRDRKRGT